MIPHLSLRVKVCYLYDVNFKVCYLYDVSFMVCYPNDARVTISDLSDVMVNSVT